ncbi:MAG: hypothetical protein Q8936_09200 [Bacillota bacterium]|nr:hypothetical protein [Bacillota bacterium]
MAGYSKVYFIGNEGKDGLNDIYLEIWQGEGDKRWYEAKYDEEKLNRIGSISSVVPSGIDDPNGLLDACIAFAPELFEDCPSLSNVSKELENQNMLDFSTGRHIPEEWDSLREEARQVFDKIPLYAADIVPYNQYTVGEKH